MEIRLAGVIESSLSNGQGVRKVIFAQGCRHNCKGCFNPETHDFNGGYLCDTDKIIKRINEDFMITGVTFSGGDPFEQPKAFAEIAKGIDKNIWCFTGYTFEQIIDNGLVNSDWFNLLRELDVLVDGKFEQDNMEGIHKFRGSANQRLIDVQASLDQCKVVLYELGD